MTATLTDLPSPLSLYLKAAASASRSPGNLRQLPPLALRLAAVQPDPARLAAYCEVCGIEPSEFLPITYPQVAVTALHMALMTQPKFPLPMLGLVHVSNRIEQFRPIGVGEAWDAEVRIGECREVRAGLDPGAQFLQPGGQQEGDGIGKADRSRIFDEFQRAVPDGGPQGMGLGLVFVPLSTVAFATLDARFRADLVALRHQHRPFQAFTPGGAERPRHAARHARFAAGRHAVDGHDHGGKGSSFGGWPASCFSSRGQPVD